MFSIITKEEKGFTQLILQETETGTFAAVIPSCGAILHSFFISQKGTLFNIIDQYDDAADFAANVASKGFRSCKLSPFACRIKNAQYHFGGTAYTIKKFLLGENALHGILYDACFAVIDTIADKEKATLVLKHTYTGNNAGYPFRYDCIITYTLKKENTLVISTEIINRDGGLIPVQDGWHPYFNFGGKINELQLEFQSKDQLLFDDSMIPTGKTIPYQAFGALKKIGDTSFDDCFTFNFSECQPLCVLRDPVKKIQLEIRPEPSYPYLQLYTPAERKSIAIECLSAAPDAFNNGMGLIVLEPGGKAAFTVSYSVRPFI